MTGKSGFGSHPPLLSAFFVRVRFRIRFRVSVMIRVRAARVRVRVRVRVARIRFGLGLGLGLGFGSMLRLGLELWLGLRLGLTIIWSIFYLFALLFSNKIYDPSVPISGLTPLNACNYPLNLIDPPFVIHNKLNFG
jgi:hypothetical protein